MADLKLQNVVKRFGEVEVIRSVDLEINHSEFCVFVGPSGCGKSTLLRMISGLEDITSGAVLIDGEEMNAVPAAKRGLAMVFQSYALYPHMSVRQNLSFGLENLNTPRDEIIERVNTAADMLQINELLDRKPKQLSGGQRQRVAIGRAVVREPKIFLFDEPLSNLDAELRVAMRGEITALHRRLGNTMIYVTHDQVEALTMADKIVVLRTGIVEQVGSPLELYNEPQNRFVAGFIGSPRMNFLDVTVKSTNGEGVELADGTGALYQAAVSPDGLSPGDSMSLGIRPEHLRFDDQNGHRVKVRSIEQLGGESYLYCQSEDGRDLTAHVEGQTRIRRGDTVNAVYRPDFLHLFRKDNGQAQKRLRMGEIE